MLGTDGYGRSDWRKELRSFFEIDRRHVVVAALQALADEGEGPRSAVKGAIEKYEIDPDKPDPAVTSDGSRSRSPTSATSTRSP